MSSNHRHILLASAGTSPGHNTVYSLDNRDQSAGFSAHALFQLLPEENRPAEIVYALTPEAREKSWESIKADAESLEIPVSAIRIASNDLPNDSAMFLKTLAGEIPEGCQLTLDVTQGLRHHAFLFFALALYLKELRNVRIEGAWYCNVKEDQPNELVNLSPVLQMSSWFHSLSVFRETGSLTPASEDLSDSFVSSYFRNFSTHFNAGMPIEASTEARKAVVKLEQMDSENPTPLFDEVREQFLQQLNPLANSDYKKNKSETVLDNIELVRQANYIDRYLLCGQLNLAFGLIREWIVSFLVFDQNDAYKQDVSWLKYDSRKPIERQLGALNEILSNKTLKSVRADLTADQKSWAKRWQKIGEVRNLLAHHGMKSTKFDPKSGAVKAVVDDWQSREKWRACEPFGGGCGKLLVSPMGQLPGALFTSIKNADPDRVIVVASTKTASNLTETLREGGFAGEFDCLELQDPHCGYDEFENILQQASPWLIKADSVEVNLTGGTSLMGVLIGELARLATDELQRDVTRFVAVDTRPYEAQKEDPFVSGTIKYLN